MNFMAIKQHKGLKDNPLYNYEFEEKLQWWHKEGQVGDLLYEM
jgi:hypothetical protein